MDYPFPKEFVMAVGTGRDSKAVDNDKDPKSTGAQPRTGAQRPSDEVASPDAADAAELASAQASGDRVAMVSRTKDGEPAQSANYVVLVDDDAPDHVKDAAHNRAGEAQGAKNLKGV